ncbi:MAG: hypothetical protein OHK0029_06720 [Armatimonadaceae bacterium]
MNYKRNGSGVYPLLLTIVAVTLLLPVTGAPALAQKPAAKVPDGLTAEKILDKAVAALGGKSALQSVKSMTTRGNLSLSGQGVSMTGAVETYVQMPDRFHTTQDLTVTLQGQKRNLKSVVVANGKKGWTREATGTVRDLTSAEITQVLAEADLGSDWKKRYREAKLLGVRKVGKSDAYAIRLTPRKEGKPVVQFYDTDSFLPLRTDVVQETPQGPIPVETYYDDYRKVAGIQVAHEIRQRFAASEIVTKVVEVKINSTIPASKFSKPGSD